MGLKIWLDGKFVDQADAKISVYDHGLLYGDGVFEGMRVYAGKLFEAEHHFRRLFESARAIRLTIPFLAEHLKAATEQTFKLNNFTDCYIRLVVTRGIGSLGLDPQRCGTASVFIIADAITLYPKEMYEHGMPVITSSIIRNHPAALSPRIKSLNYLNNIMAKWEAVDAGVPEAVMLNHVGNVAECTADNIFIAKAGTLFTPTTTDGILEGVTRKVIIDLCAKHNICCVEKTLQKHDLYVADEFFLTGSGAEVIPVTKIDGRLVGTGQPGPITRRLIEAFHAYVRS